MKRYKTAARMIAAATIAMSSMGIAVSQGIAATDNGGYTQKGETIFMAPADVCEGQPSNWEVHWDDAGSYCACTGFHCSGGGDDEPPRPGDDNEPPRPGGGGGGGFCDENPDALSCQDEPEEENTCEGEEPSYEICGDETCGDCKDESSVCEDQATSEVASCFDLNRQRATAYCNIIGTPTASCINAELTGTPSRDSGGSTADQLGGHTEGGFTMGGLVFQGGASGGATWGTTTTITNSSGRPYIPPSDSYRNCKALARDLGNTCVSDSNACYEVAEGDGATCETR